MRKCCCSPKLCKLLNWVRMVVRLWLCHAAVSTAAIHSASTKALQTFGAAVSVQRAAAWLAYLRVEGEGRGQSVESVFRSVRAKVPGGVIMSFVFDSVSCFSVVQCVPCTSSTPGRSSYREHDAGGMMGEAYHTTATHFNTDQHPD